LLLQLKYVSICYNYFLFIDIYSCLIQTFLISQCSLNKKHTGTGSSLDQERIDVCKQDTIITKTDSSLNYSYKLYYHFIYNIVLYLMYIIILTKICNVNLTHFSATYSLGVTLLTNIHLVQRLRKNEAILSLL